MLEKVIFWRVSTYRLVGTTHVSAIRVCWLIAGVCGATLPCYVCMALLLKVKLAVERQQQSSGLQRQVFLPVVDVNGCQQVLRQRCTRRHTSSF